MALEKELATFHRALPSLLQDKSKRGKFALVHGDEIHSYWPTLEVALKAGYDQFGIGAFLVKEVMKAENPQHFSRNLSRCR